MTVVLQDENNTRVDEVINKLSERQCAQIKYSISSSIS